MIPFFFIESARSKNFRTSWYAFMFQQFPIFSCRFLQYPFSRIIDLWSSRSLATLRGATLYCEHICGTMGCLISVPRSYLSPQSFFVHALYPTYLSASPLTLLLPFFILLYEQEAKKVCRTDKIFCCLRWNFFPCLICCHFSEADTLLTYSLCKFVK